MTRDTTSKYAVVLNWIVNVALGVAVLAFAGVLVKRYYGQPAHIHETAPPLEQGMKFALPDTDWAANKQTIVLGLSADCRFCTESAPLYRRISEGVRGRDIKVLALMPQTVSEGQKYLGDLQIRADEVRKVVLPKYGIHTTPTLALVDNEGTVTDLWVGKLGVNAEMALLDRIGASEQADSSEGAPEYPGMTAAELRSALKGRHRVVVVDVDTRDRFLEEHVPGAINIPHDELETRAENELDAQDTIVVYCRCPSDGLSLTALEQLVSGGFDKVFVLKGGVDAWKRAGADVEVGPTRVKG